MKITLLYQVSHYIRVKKQRNIKSWDQQNYLVIRGFCYIRPRYNEVPLYWPFVQYGTLFCLPLFTILFTITYYFIYHYVSIQLDVCTANSALVESVVTEELATT